MDNGQKRGSAGILQACAELQFKCLLLHVDRQVTSLTAAGETRAGDVLCAAPVPSDVLGRDVFAGAQPMWLRG